MDGLGYSTVTKGSKYFLEYNYKGYSGVIEIAKTKTAIFSYEYDIVNKNDEIIGKGTKEYRKVKDEKTAETLIMAELNNNVFETEAYKRWCVENFGYDYAKAEVWDETEYKQDLIDNHNADFSKDDEGNEPSIEDVVKDKIFKTSPNGKLLVINKV